MADSNTLHEVRELKKKVERLIQMVEALLVAQYDPEKSREMISELARSRK